MLMLGLPQEAGCLAALSNCLPNAGTVLQQAIHFAAVCWCLCMYGNTAGQLCWSSLARVGLTGFQRASPAHMKIQPAGASSSRSVYALSLSVATLAAHRDILNFWVQKLLSRPVKWLCPQQEAYTQSCGFHMLWMTERKIAVC